MAGHSKWANIKHKKAREDKKRGKIFTKIVKEIIVSTREGGKDLEMNPRLRLAIDEAKNANMPKKNIERAIARGAGEVEGVNYEEYVYEGYGINGVAIILDVVTDNKNRTVAEIRHIFDKYGGNLAENGAVSWNFEKKGRIIILKNEEVDEDEIMMDALEAGAEDIKTEGKIYQVITDFTELHNVKDELDKKYEIVETKTAQIPKNTIKADDFAEDLLVLIENLEDLDDVQAVHSNYEISDEVLEGLED